jgi:hypothetical protein
MRNHSSRPQIVWINALTITSVFIKILQLRLRPAQSKKTTAAIKTKIKWNLKKKSIQFWLVF